MEHYRPAPGTPLKDLDTPCLLIDLDAVEHNFRLIADTYQDTVCKMRTHVKNLKSPILAHMQIRAGGTVGGVCAAKVAEAEGDAQATLVKAKAQAEANRLLQETLNPLLVQSKAIDRWNGILPQFSGSGTVPFVNLTPELTRERDGGH